MHFLAPLVPDLISEEMNLVVALLLGIAFGVVLEQAGFSSSRRLAGVFYGYDFTVLRVFFTAGITAMLGVLLLASLGVLDADMIYVNPTFLGPALVGGVIMGVGFILGGYCPGTSLCAAAIGKKDALSFVLGGLVGVYVFGELFPLYDAFFASGALGPIKIHDSLGIPQALFVVLLIGAAVGIFAVTTRIERAVNPLSPTHAWRLQPHLLAAMGLLALGLLVACLPDYRTSVMTTIHSEEFRQDHAIRPVSPDELVFRILDEDPSLVVVDVRPPADFASLSLPGAINIPVPSMFGKEHAEMLGMRHREYVFVDRDGSTAGTAASIAALFGYDRIAVLEGGMDAVDSTILRFQPVAIPTSPAQADVYRFREKAGPRLVARIAEQKERGVRAPAATKKIQGGC